MMLPLGWSLVSGILIIAVLVAVCVFIVASLVQLRKARIDEVSRALWAFMIILLPVAGSAVFFIVRPGGGNDV